MSTYKLAFAVTKFVPYGGMQRTMLRIARECVNRGHTVDLFTGCWRGERPPDVTVHELSLRALTNHGRNDEMAAALEKEVTRDSHACVVGFTKIRHLDVYYGGDPCFSARVNHTKPRVYLQLPRYRALLRQESEVFQRGLDTEIMLIAHPEKESFQHYYKTEEHRFHLLPPGIDRERFEGAEISPDVRRRIRSDFGLAEADFFVLMVGSSFRTKGVDRAIKALAALPKSIKSRTKLVVAGEGRATPYQQLANRLNVGDRLVFAGIREDAPELYRSADALLHPAINENTGTTLIEAMLCGLPVLVTENCGFAGHVRDADAGLVCPLAFVQTTLNRQLEAILTDDRRSQWRDNGMQYCRGHDLYSLITRAADVIVARAARNRESRFAG